MALSGTQYQHFMDALLAAYPARLDLQIMLQVRLEKNLNAIANTNNLETDIYLLIQAAVAQGWTARLLAAARESRPDNPLLLAFSQQFGLASTRVSRPELERTIVEGNSYLDVAKWRKRLGEIETQVCRIEIPLEGGKEIRGTGFLVRPDAVLTNYHVMAPAIADREGQATPNGLRAKAGQVTLRFDYKVLEDGTTLNKGTPYRLASDWLIACSPYSRVDALPEPGAQLPGEDELDFALLRLDSSPGSEKVGGKAEASATPRGYIKIPQSQSSLSANSALYIMQHPDGAPLKLAIQTQAVLGLNANGTRLRYRTSTESGSSGSPCFDSNWEPVALHHLGDPNFDPAHKPTYNQGIPLTAIREYLRRHGKEAELDEQEL